VSHAYPFAEGGAWAEVPDGQRLWGEPLAAGWWAGGTELTRQLVSLGATEPAGAADPADGVEDAAVAAESPAATPPTSSPDLALVATGSAVLVGLGLLAGAGWWLRRRRGLHPAQPV
jgi:LPXTG-motif cell wall-anchored protein